jgi:hypothetical protein
MILNHARAEMLQVLDDADPHMELSPGWRLREVLAHIAGWDAVIAACLQAHADGEAYTPVDFPGTDAFNRQSLEARSQLSYEQVAADWKQQRENLVAVLRAIPPEKFEQPLVFPWGQVGAIEDVLRGFASHERRHTGEFVQKSS